MPFFPPGNGCICLACTNTCRRTRPGHAIIVHRELQRDHVVGIIHASCTFLSRFWGFHRLPGSGKCCPPLPGWRRPKTSRSPQLSEGARLPRRLLRGNARQMTGRVFLAQDLATKSASVGGCMSGVIWSHGGGQWMRGFPGPNKRLEALALSPWDSYVAMKTLDLHLVRA